MFAMNNKSKSEAKRSIFTLAKKVDLIKAVKKGKDEGKSRREVAEELKISSKTLDSVWANRNNIERHIKNNPNTRITVNTLISLH